MNSTLPRYHFIIRWPDREHRDPDGTRFPDVASARRYAERVVRELRDSGGDYDDPDLRMVVTDGDGNEVFTLPMSKTSTMSRRQHPRASMARISVSRGVSGVAMAA